MAPKPTYGRKGRPVCPDCGYGMVRASSDRTVRCLRCGWQGTRQQLVWEQPAEDS